MTRINVGIKPKELPDKLLLAEHREITRIPNTIASGKAVLGEFSDNFKLGTGHVKFFYDKILYLFKRYSALYQECVHRGFQVTDKSSAFDKDKIEKELWKDYEEKEADRDIILQRIESKGFKLLKEEEIKKVEEKIQKYFIVVSYKGRDTKKDGKIANFSPDNRSGSGFCFLDGRRDISFSFETEVKLEDKIQEFRKIAKEQKIRVKIEGYYA